MKKIIAILVLVSISTWNFAQKHQKEEDRDSIIVEVKREVEPSVRIGGQPKLIDTVVNYKVVEYPMMVLKYETVITTEPIVPANVKLSENKMLKLYNGYVKVGIGSPLMPLGEVYYNNTRSRKYVYGANIKHISSFGELKGYAPAQFDRTNYNLFGGIKQLNYSILGDVRFNNYGVNRYGVMRPSADKDSINQRFKEIGGGIKFHSHKMDSLRLNYLMSLDYTNFKDKPVTENWFGNENTITSLNSFWYRKGKEIFGVDVNVYQNQFMYGNADKKLTPLDSTINYTNTLASLRPTITSLFSGKKLKAQIGVDVTMSLTKNTSTLVTLYPLVDIKYALFDNLIIPYVGVKGGMKQGTFKSLATQNPFLQSNPELRNESTPYNAFLGVRGIITKQLEFNVSANYSEVRNKVLFVSDSNAVHRNLNQFRAIYDTMNIFSAEATVAYQLNEKIKVDATGRFFNYSMIKHNNYAWNLPTYQFIVRGSYVYQNKFIFTLDVNGEGGRKALIYDSTDKDETTIEDNQIAKDLGFIIDANVGVEYRYTNRISAFLQCNNVAAQQYFRWYKYPVQAFQIMGGVTFRF
jgi:hypothetical protein